MKVSQTELPGILVLDPVSYDDDRGYFMETWNKGHYETSGVSNEFVQDNVASSKKGVLRGLHFQNPRPQGKLVSVLYGEVFDVAVDLRVESRTFKKWCGVNLSAENKRQMYIPAGFAHGYVVLSEHSLFQYKCTEYYSPETEQTLLWNDPEIGIRWPVTNPVLSPKDARGERLANMDRKLLF